MRHVHRTLICCILTILSAAAAVYADPGPGDIFRELPMNIPFWQRVTDPNAAASGAKEFPNTINRKLIEDLQGAVRAEIYLEMWGGHAGTSDKRLRVNGGDWISIPDPEAIPGDAGREAYQRSECYQQFIYPSVPVPLEQLHEGVNTLEFTSGGQTCFNFGWGQWGVHGITFRIYYDESKPHPTGRIVTPVTGSTIADSVVLAAAASSPNGDIAEVDFIGLYDDFDYEGNGIYRQWHYRYQAGRIQNHLATATTSPYRVHWHTTWVPDQDEPMQIMARIRDETGLSYMTPAVADISLLRPGTSVRLYRPFNVPARWQTRVGAIHSSKVFVADDLTRADTARMVLTTWNGFSADAVGINGIKVSGGPGRDHSYSYDELPVPIDAIRNGTNSLYTFDGTLHHGIEVLWPGIALLVRYSGLETQAPERPILDLPIFADEVSSTWNLAVRFNARLEESPIAYSGSTALAIAPSRSFFSLLEATSTGPVALDGYHALHLAVNLDGQSLTEWHWLKLQVNDRLVDLLKDGQGSFGFSSTKQGWQIVEVPLTALSLRFPYVESIRLEGRLDGSLLVDDIRLLVAVEVPTSIAQDPVAVAPSGFLLRQNFPNPFNGGTSLQFDLPQEGDVELSIYNLVGQKVVTLTQGHRLAGKHSLQWDGRDALGRELASGVYIYRLRTQRQILSRRLLLVR
jgi:hypothetical protein